MDFNIIIISFWGSKDLTDAHRVHIGSLALLGHKSLNLDLTYFPRVRLSQDYWVKEIQLSFGSLNNITAAHSSVFFGDHLGLNKLGVKMLFLFIGLINS